MKFRTEFDISTPEFLIDHTTPIFSIGSCFAENIAHYLESRKFPILSNPFGITYNLLSIENSLLRLYSEQNYEATELFEYNGLFHSWDHHSSFSDVNSVKTLEKINSKWDDARHFLEHTQVVIITIGTSYYYQLNDAAQIVNNCHKVPPKEFSKKLLSVEEGLNSLNNSLEIVRKLSKEKLHFILTLSPVFHLRDGALENSRSKAIALETIWRAKEQNEDVYYFPSYEICNTELRDYRFYAEDMAHPSSQTQKYIWQRFSELFFNEKTKSINHEVSSVSNNVKHRPLFPNSEANIKRKQSIENQINELQLKYPFLNFTEEKNQLKNDR